jgi:hypothetical protein
MKTPEVVIVDVCYRECSKRDARASLRCEVLLRLAKVVFQGTRSSTEETERIYH